jgi:hypothetical protein
VTAGSRPARRGVSELLQSDLQSKRAASIVEPRARAREYGNFSRQQWPHSAVGATYESGERLGDYTTGRSPEPHHAYTRGSSDTHAEQ